MKFWEDSKFKDNYPKFLTQQEKACIKQALIQQLASGNARSLQQFLEDYRLIIDYPETH